MTFATRFAAASSTLAAVGTAVLLSAGCAGQLDHNELAERVAALEAEAARERHEEQPPPPNVTTSTTDAREAADCADAKKRWLDYWPRRSLWWLDNEPDLYAEWLGALPGTPEDDRLWQALEAAEPEEHTLEAARLEAEGQLHCGYAEFNDYVDIGYDTGDYPD